ncbi:TIGR03621 family F420-dependent LLM class oxidoreductase [Streptomyces sp. SID10853]|uniref:TIGR03621 family F420-dependent LLM class oxidoreductase n=1 Tax=Streptomyces sp. SID10853 TaxID=2706028 RepID=UPI0013C03604|nr:TIGR03621 family F420-dependent LLM class oxidoreductase [Streptomyces sp. SID10853]NDZ80101.1 TIGR03621 family F420-dependent LLM class oxidoreductase [Streptomyces sp. SID10853]
MTRPFRFGVNMLRPEAGAQWRDKCRRAEQLGYDVILVPDHLGMVAPFPALVAAAAATRRPRLGTFVLNAGFWNPALLAREAATTDALTDGRLEVGLGAGYAEAEHEQARLEFLPPGDRVRALRHTVGELERLLTDPAYAPSAAQRPRPPLLIGGNGDRLLRLMAEHADIAAFTAATGYVNGMLNALTSRQLDERVATYERFAAHRAVPAERNLLVHFVEVTDDRRATARRLPKVHPELSQEERLTLPVMLFGTVKQIAEQLREQRERFGISYVVVLDGVMDAFGPVIEELAGS